MLAGCTGYEEEEIPDRSGSGSGRAMREYPRSTSESFDGNPDPARCLNIELGKRRFFVEFEDIGRDIGTQVRVHALIVFFERLGSREQMFFLYGVGKLYAVETGSRNEPAEYYKGRSGGRWILKV